MIVPVLLLTLALILAYVGSQRSVTRIQLAIVTLFLCGGAAMVVRPNLANRVAALLNVGRGADLLMYFAVLCGVLITANFYFRFKQNERAVTEIVRQLALLTPTHPSEEQ